jgi:hypothetical protein
MPPKNSQKKVKTDQKKSHKPKSGKTRPGVISKPVIKPARVNVPRQLVSSRGLRSLSECAAMFAIAAVDPWNPRAFGVCLPYGNSSNSIKAATFIRGTATVLASGLLVIELAPNLASDVTSLYCTNGVAGVTQSAGNATINAANLAGSWTQYGHNGPFTAANLTGVNSQESALAQGRFVAGGMKCTYLGAPLAAAGQQVCFVEPNHNNVNALNATITSYPNTSIDRVTFDPCDLVVCASNEAEFAYHQAADSSGPMQYGAGLAVSDEFNGAILYTAATLPAAQLMYVLFGAPTGATVMVDAIMHFEYQSPNLSTMASPSIDDPRGFGIVQTAIARYPVLKRANPRANALQLMDSLITEVVGELVPIGGRFAWKATKAIAKSAASALHW